MFRTAETLASKQNREERVWSCNCALDVPQKDHAPYTSGRHGGSDVLFEPQGLHYPAASAGSRLGNNPPRYPYWMTPEATPPLTGPFAGDYAGNYDLSSGIMDGFLIPDGLLPINKGHEPTHSNQATATTGGPPSSSSPTPHGQQHPVKRRRRHSRRNGNRKLEWHVSKGPRPRAWHYALAP